MAGRVRSETLGEGSLVQGAAGAAAASLDGAALAGASPGSTGLDGRRLAGLLLETPRVGRAPLAPSPRGPGSRCAAAAERRAPNSNAS
ncbi:MAG: hypothetical protein CMN31_04850 [Sandaracinus sp.]|nr:hypothetical protein [Sandaracinus sp.]MBJ70659.1 hypothetical protein [Sandaracinus sp.]